MSTDLQELFDQAARTAPTSHIDADDVIRRGRLVRVRRRTAAGGALLGVGAAVAASAVLVSGLAASGAITPVLVPAGGGVVSQGSALPTTQPSSLPDTPTPVPSGSASDAPSSVVVTLEPGELSVGDRARLDAVTLADPAPGFPVRRWNDPQRPSPEGLAGGTTSWSKVWGLAVTPYRRETTGPGQVSEIPTGPEVTLSVGYRPMPAHGEGLGIYDRERFVEDVTVAGARGWVTTTSDKGTPVRNLYVKVGELTVWIGGMGGVTTAQLVALGNSLGGLR